jgi:hypothetical protein
MADNTLKRLSNESIIDNKTLEAVTGGVDMNSAVGTIIAGDIIPPLPDPNGMPRPNGGSLSDIKKYK